MFGKVEIMAIIGSSSLLAMVLELIRRKKLREEYSLLWLLTSIVLLILSLWRSLMDIIARLMGVLYPPSALFAVGFGFGLLILLQFSVIISRLSAQNRELAQRLAILGWKLQQLEKEKSK